MCCVCTHQVHKVQREYVDTAGHSGQSTDDSGENAETTCAEQKVLQRNTHSENKSKYDNTVSISVVRLCHILKDQFFKSVLAQC